MVSQAETNPDSSVCLKAIDRAGLRILLRPAKNDLLNETW